MKSALAPLLVGALAIAPAAHAEEANPPQPDPYARQHALDHLRSMWRYELGYRGEFVTNPGYNPFSNQDYFSQVSMTASRTVYSRGPFSFAPGVSWDYGKSSATARGDAASLEVHRLVVALEGRMHFGPWGYAFARAAPGIALVNAEVDDPSAPAPLTRSRWLAAGDVSAGYAFPFLARLDAPEAVPRFWLQADGGYGWVAEEQLDLAAALASDDPRTVAGVNLGTLGLRGGFFRIAIAASF